MSSLQVDSISSMGGGHVDGAGLVVQVIQETLTGQFLNYSDSFQKTGLKATITPSSTSSKILVSVTPSAYGETAGRDTLNYFARVTKNDVSIVDFGRLIIQTGGRSGNDLLGVGSQPSLTYLDSPSSTSPLTYELEIRGEFENMDNVRLNKDGIGTSIITLWEIAQ